MSDEQSLTELETVQVDTVETVATESEDVKPEALQAEDVVEEKSEEQTKTFTQEDLDSIVTKRLARERRKWEREAHESASNQKLDTFVSNPPDISQFDTPEEYAEALALVKAEELVKSRDAKNRERAIVETFQEKEEKVQQKYDDYEQVVYNSKLAISDVMLGAITESEIGPEIAYYLGSNLKEASRIYNLSSFSQAKEIGKIELKLMENPVVKKTTSAPAPISPVTSKSTPKLAVDTTDPRAIKELSVEEWIAAERQRQIRKQKASIS